MSKIRNLSFYTDDTANSFIEEVEEQGKEYQQMRPEDLYKAPRTRNSAVTCLAFGPNRKEKFPCYFFCHGCDLFEDAILCGNKRAHRKRRHYTCTGGHEGDRTHPTTLRHMYRPNNNKDLSTPRVNVDSSSSSDDDDTRAERRCTSNKMPRRPCAEESTTTPRAPDTESSPTKSTLKKKVRPSAVRRQPLRYTAEGGISNEESTNSSDKEEDEVGEDATTHQQFATALSFLDADDGGHDDTAEQVLLLLFSKRGC